MRCGVDALPLREPVEISYRRADGTASERTISVLRFFESADGRSYARAYCHLRCEERTFRLDRIEQIGRTAAAASQPPEANRAAPVTARGGAAGEGRVARLAKAIFGLAGAACALLVLGHPSVEGSSGTGRLDAAFTAETRAQIEALLSRYGADAGGGETGGSARVEEAPGGSGSGAAAAEEGVPSRAARVSAFVSVTAIRDEALLAGYAAADTSGEGTLDWQELEAFQREADRRYRYRNNETALAPDAFLAARGGDCEDWALLTCGLIRFWGGQCYVAEFAGSGERGAHALAFVKAATLPAGYRYWDFRGSPPALAGSAAGKRAAPGIYVPVDYASVGALTNAVRPGWRLRRLYMPERLYSKPM